MLIWHPPLSHQTPYFALYQLLGAGVFEAKVYNKSISAHLTGDFKAFWGEIVFEAVR